MLLKAVFTAADYGNVRLATLLKADAADLTEPVARFWIGLLHRHRIVMSLVDLGFDALLVAAAWIFVGPTAGVIVLVATLALYGYGVVGAWRYWRRTRR